MTDLILDKSIKISEITNEYNWPTAESLKIPNLYRYTNLLYVYVKARLNMLSGKGKKFIKDGASKAIENLIKILKEVIDENIKLENNLIYICFEDLFSFYCLSNFDEKSKESIEDLISLYSEDSNISGLAKMENIDKIAETNFFKGSLVALLRFKLDIINQNKDINLTDVENIYKHEKVLRNSCFLLNVNFVWIFSCYKFINEKNNDTNFKLCETCLDLFKISKNYKQFLLPNKSNFISIVTKHLEKLRTLIIIFYVNNSIKLTDSFFLVLDYDTKLIEELKSTSNHNLFQIIKIIKNNNVKDYKMLNFEQNIIQKLENNKGKISNELRDKYNELIIDKEKKIDEKDIKNNEGYLKLRLNEENKKYKDLILF